MMRMALVADAARPPYGNNLNPPVRALAQVSRARLFAPSSYPGFTPTGAAAPAPLPPALVEDLTRWAPQVVVCLGGGLYLPLSTRAGLADSVVLVGVALSDPQALPASLAIAPHFDLFYTQEPGCLEAYARAGVAARYLALAADPAALFPAPAVQSCDVLYVGKWTPYRQALLAALAEVATVRVIAYRGETRWQGAVAPQVDDEESLRREIVAARLVLDPTRVEASTDPRRDAYRITPRAFMAAACGVPALVEETCPLGGAFVPGEEIITFDCTPAGCARVARELLEDLQRRRRVGEAARRRVLAQHTWAHRAAQILADVRALRPTLGAESSAS